MYIQSKLGAPAVLLYDVLLPPPPRMFTPLGTPCIVLQLQYTTLGIAFSWTHHPASNLLCFFLLEIFCYVLYSTKSLLCMYCTLWHAPCVLVQVPVLIHLAMYVPILLFFLHLPMYCPQLSTPCYTWYYLVLSMCFFLSCAPCHVFYPHVLVHLAI
jgi:hypothetical protein